MDGAENRDGDGTGARDRHGTGSPAMTRVDPIVTVAAATSRGCVREANEDAYRIVSSLRGESAAAPALVGLVADGMGGANAGEVASVLACDVTVAKLEAWDGAQEGPESREHRIRDALLTAHEAVLAHQTRHPETRGMGTTVVLAWIEAGWLHVGWVGDSRCYVLPRAGIEANFPLTEDHTPVWDQLRAGRIDAEEAWTHPDRHLLSQSLGDPHRPPVPGVRSVPLTPGMRILLCSDGLNGMLPDQVLREKMAAPDPLDVVCEGLVTAAKEAGGHDNITCVLFEVGLSERMRDPAPPSGVAPALLPVPTARIMTPLGALAAAAAFVTVATIAAVFLFWILAR
jgi:serine/threonine protein phosphatase PrpC